MRPLLRHRPLRLLRLGDGFPRLDLAPQHDVAEAVAQQVAFGLEQAERVAEFVREHQFERRVGESRWATRVVGFFSMLGLFVCQMEGC